MKLRMTIIAAAMLAATGILGASEANALSGVNGWSLNGVAMNGSQGFDFNNASVETVSWTGDCPLPLDRGKAVFCALGTSAEKRP